MENQVFHNLAREARKRELNPLIDLADKATGFLNAAKRKGIQTSQTVVNLILAHWRLCISARTGEGETAMLAQTGPLLLYIESVVLSAESAITE